MQPPSRTRIRRTSRRAGPPAPQPDATPEPVSVGAANVPAVTDTTWLDATAQAELVRSGEASPKELVEAAIDRIERVNPQLNAVVRDRFDAARAEAA